MKTMETGIYSGPVFDMARQQLTAVADYLAVPDGDRDRCLYPKRAVAVACPIPRVMARVERDGVSHRTAAMAVGVEKVADAKRTRGLFP